MKLVIFDMDGTLVDSLSFWGYLWRRIGKRYFNDEDFVPAAEDDRRVRTMIFGDAMRWFFGKYRIGGEEADFLEFAELGIPQFYRTVARPKEGATELLRALRDGGAEVRLASATEKKHLPVALAACGLDGMFDGIFSCSELGAGKDRPDIFLKALEGTGLSPEECWVVEDSCTALLTAKRAGFCTVGVFDRYSPAQDILQAEADHYLGEGRSLAELIPVLLEKI